MRRAFAAAALVLAAAVASAGDDNPLDGLRSAMKEQDAMVDAGKADAAVAAARARAKDGTPESWYLLGRALGNAAVKRMEKEDYAEAGRLLDEASESFERAHEAGGLTYAPAHLGRARVSRFRFDLGMRAAQSADDATKARAIAASQAELDSAIAEYRQALQISPNFKDAAIELAQALWEKRLPSDAEYVLHQFLERRPADAEARLLLGLLKLQRKRFAEAEPEFRAVLAGDPAHPGARKMLAACLMYQDKFAESAEHWEMVRGTDPKDAEAYITLFHVYRQLRKKTEAVAVLEALRLELPGSEPAKRAKELLDKLAEDPSGWDAKPADTSETLVAQLDSRDPATVQTALEAMRKYQWPALPAAAYRLLQRNAGTPGQRVAAMRLIGDHADPQTLTILEILLQHPTERDPDSEVRKEAAHAIARLATDAIVPILFDALTDADPDVREWAVQGIASRTGKWFRPDLAVRTPDADWAAELKLYTNWWATSSASSVKRAAARAMSEIYGKVERGSKSRVARYAMPAMDDGIESTWRAGYDLFRALTFVTFGADKGSVEPDERRRITNEAREWLKNDQAGKK